MSEKKTKTTKAFKDEVYNLVGNEYKVLEEYIDSSTPIEVQHSKCGHIYLVRPNNFLTGYRCPDCNGCIKKTTEKFKKEVYDLVKEEYEVIGEYINNRTPINIKHNICGYIYPVRPYSFLSGNRCPRCNSNIKKTTEEFKKEIYDKVKDEYEVIGEYVNNKTPINIKHSVCGSIYLVTPHNFLAGNRCPECNRRITSERMSKTKEEFEIEFYNQCKNEYEIIGEYISNKTPLEIKHNKCGYIYPVRPYSFLAGSRCPECSRKIRAKQLTKTTNMFKKEVYNLVGDEYEVLEEYIRCDKYIKIKHNTCGYIYPVTPHNFLTGKRCPKCNSSKGELTIIQFFNKYNVKYKHNKPYKSCSYKGLLKFDFLVFDENDNLKLIVEFDGIQHFESVDIFGGEEGFEETQIRDNIKNNFCKENNIPLLRIPYWEIDNIYKILGKKIYKLGLIKNK